MTFRTLNLVEARQCLSLSRENTPASKGRHVGAGPHVPLVEEWDGQSDDVPLGWTGVPLSTDEEKGEYLVHIDDHVESLKGAKLSQLRAFKARSTVEAASPVVPEKVTKR